MTFARGAVADVVEVDAEGVVDDAVPFQFDAPGDLTLLLTGTTSADATRYYHVYFSETCRRRGPRSAPACEEHIVFTDDVEHEGQASYKIETPGGTYLYHKRGAGFASLFDADGNDWISFHPWGGSDGRYRGIPNVVYPEGYFHPGGMDCTSRIVSAGPLKVTIASESNDGGWACRWDIFPRYATLTVLKVAHPYWFLYEGTPGGALDEAGDFIVRSDGTRTPASERWDGAIPAPEWLYFGASNTSRVLYFVHHEPDDAVDSYWPMEHNMTVFGFGRLGLEKFMTAVPAHFTVGFAETGDFDDVARADRFGLSTG